MAENALIKVLLDEGSYLSLNASVECGVESGLGTVLSRPVSVLLFSQMIKGAAAQKISALLDKTLSGGLPLLMLFSDCEKADAAFCCGDFLQQLIRLSGVCPVLALVEKEPGDAAARLLPFADFSIYASGMHERTSSCVQALDLPAAVECLRTLLSFLPLNCAERAPLLQASEKLSKDIGANEILKGIADDQALFEIYRDGYALAGFARIGGRVAGLLWSEKAILPRHAARFMQFCDCYSLPLLMGGGEKLSLDDTQLFMLAQATVAKLYLGDAGEYKQLFDLTLCLEGMEAVRYDTLATIHNVRSEICNALEFLSVKRDVLPPHKHGNMPI